jgi:protein TonB
MIGLLLAVALAAPKSALPEGVSCNTSKNAAAIEQEIPDAPEFEPPQILERADAVAPVGRESESVKVLVRVVVCTDGIPRTPTIVISGTKEFDAAAAAAVLRWKFAPGKRYGVPAAMSYTTLVKFGPATGPAEREPAAEAQFGS